MRGEEIADVVRGRALVFPLEQAEAIRGLMISPVGVVEEKAKRRIVHDMTLGGNRKRGERGSVNETTDWSKIPECALAEVMSDIVKRILGLRAKFGTGGRILTQQMDVKSAIRQIGVDPAGAAAFGYVIAYYIVVDMWLQFGWRGSPGW